MHLWFAGLQSDMPRFVDMSFKYLAIRPAGSFSHISASVMYSLARGYLLSFFYL